ncbi:hypothetical protein J7E93_13730 [Streptomyces sp. ISL-36]|uniref:hypothetical protein n=1 Tax=Streptomyces sp. ISL-36 TaxID=2819182 RepID=UPI001BED18FE|nr:hypothetical protein [Streptomyces sp. ISL-36]MBT2441151.1 hypothetical protein [Streptomyces sp. ISL-36]
MKDFIARLAHRLLRGTGGPASSPAPALHPSPYTCLSVDGPTRHRTGERPARGEDSPLVRPYLLAYERRQGRRRVVLLAAHGLELRPGTEGAA